MELSASAWNVYTKEPGGPVGPPGTDWNLNRDYQVPLPPHPPVFTGAHVRVTVPSVATVIV